MSFSLMVARRYLRASSSNRYFSVISFLSTAGVTISCAAMIVVLAVISGFEDELRDRFLSANAHIMAFRYPGGMTNYAKWQGIIERDFGDQVVGTAPFIHSETMVRSGPVLHGVVVRGIDPVKRQSVQSFGQVIQPASALTLIEDEVTAQALPEVPSLILGVGVLKILGANLGDIVSFISPSEDQSTLLYEFKIVGVYDSGLKFYDNRVAIMSIPSAQRLFSMGTLVTGLEIGVQDPDLSLTISQQMEEKYNLSFRDWQTFNKPLFETMKFEKRLIALIVGLVGMVACFNIFMTNFIAVSQKQRDISILKSMGASKGRIVRIFLTQGAVIGFLGGLFGMILAFGISSALESFLFFELPDPYFLRRLPVVYSPGLYAGVFAVACISSILASAYPAFVAAGVDPAAGFRGNAGFS